MVQFSTEKSVDIVVSKWDRSLFRGSAARKTIKLNTTIGMIKGVPLNIPDSDIESDIHKLENAATVYRMKTRDGSCLQTVKVTFTVLYLKA